MVQSLVCIAVLVGRVPQPHSFPLSTHVKPHLAFLSSNIASEASPSTLFRFYLGFLNFCTLLQMLCGVLLKYARPKNDICPFCGVEAGPRFTVVEEVRAFG
jgi:hypothetical protein